ncbi:Arsenite_methyltransferase [Hexamita inflata]|uniref:Arsenite methyltransferase n=1 Tax=Hexamita inflata TaxID=28002 RepID=A0AA86V5D4_9EUKA|nr:Arsenite methyltransferase [Hexamita inflata]
MNCTDKKCCEGNCKPEEEVRQQVREQYSKIATQKCCGTGVSCCGSAPQAADQLAKTLGYTVEQLKMLPEGANMGLSCGNPSDVASLKEGDIVLDLGSGGGMDVFVAGLTVGQTGRAIGVDMTAAMIDKARQNAKIFTERSGLSNVEFRLGEIEHLPCADSSVDVVISNCVLNLSQNKEQVWREIFRVLKPNGRVSISDMALLKLLPPQVKQVVNALYGGVTGAVLETQKMVENAGLTNVVLKQKPEYVAAMTSFNDPLYKEVINYLPKDATPSDYLSAVEVQANKPK